jgi:hypothetical protein
VLKLFWFPSAIWKIVPTDHLNFYGDCCLFRLENSFRIAACTMFLRRFLGTVMFFRNERHGKLVGQTFDDSTKREELMSNDERKNQQNQSGQQGGQQGGQGGHGGQQDQTNKPGQGGQQGGQGGQRQGGQNDR